MKHRLSLWIAFAALALRLVAPLAAYAAQPTFIGEICSARDGTSASLADARTGTPQAPMDAHLLSHCADCPCGTSALPPPPAYALPPLAAAPAPVPQEDAPPVRCAGVILFPPPRGPPSIACLA